MLELPLFIFIYEMRHFIKEGEVIAANDFFLSGSCLACLFLPKRQITRQPHALISTIIFMTPIPPACRVHFWMLGDILLYIASFDHVLFVSCGPKPQIRTKRELFRFLCCIVYS